MDQNSSSGKMFDLNSEGGVGVVLASIRAGDISPAKKNELRDLVFSYTNSKGDINIKDQLQVKLAEYGVQPIQLASVSKTQNTIFPFGSARPAPVFSAPVTTKKAPTVATEPKPVEDTSVPSKPEETAPQNPTKEPAPTETESNKAPAGEATVSNDKSINNAKIDQETSISTSPDPAPIDIKNELVKTEEPAPTSSPTPTSTPGSSPTVPDTNKSPQAPVSTPSTPVTRSEPPTDALTSMPVNQDRLSRIKEIKQAVNSKVGNPVNLIDIDNTVGREYMAALLDAMKKLNQGNALDMNTAMTRLEAAYKAVEVAVNKSKNTPSTPSVTPSQSTAPSATVSTPDPVPQTAPNNVVPNTPSSAPAPTPTPAPSVSETRAEKDVSPSQQVPAASVPNTSIWAQSSQTPPRPETTPKADQAQATPSPQSNIPPADRSSVPVNNTPPTDRPSTPLNNASSTTTGNASSQSQGQGSQTQISNTPSTPAPTPVSKADQAPTPTPSPADPLPQSGYANYAPDPNRAPSAGNVPPTPTPTTPPEATKSAVRPDTYTPPVVSNAQPTVASDLTPAPTPTAGSASVPSPRPSQPTPPAPASPVPPPSPEPAPAQRPVAPASQPPVGGFANLAAIPNLADSTPTSPVTTQSTQAVPNQNQANSVNIPIQPHVDAPKAEKSSLVEKASSFASHLVENLGLKHDDKKQSPSSNTLPIDQMPQVSQHSQTPQASLRPEPLRPLSGGVSASQSAPAKTTLEPISAAKAPLTPADLPETKELPENISDMSLYSPEIDYGLDQLLQEWILFNKSGLFGTGPKGREHPLFKQLAKLEMPIILTGRFEGATPEIKQSITDYMNGWRYEQGIIYEQSETFEDYLHRVIRHILDLQRNKRKA